MHLLAYLSWPVALAHGIGASKDLQQGRLLGLAVGCVLVVVAAVAWRLAAAARQVPRAGRVAAVFAEHTSQSSRRARPWPPAGVAMTAAAYERSRDRDAWPPAGLPRLLPSRPEDLRGHLARFGPDPVPRAPPEC